MQQTMAVTTSQMSIGSNLHRDLTLLALACIHSGAIGVQ